MIDFTLEFRNGCGVDLCLMPKQLAVGYHEDGGATLLEIHYFRLLLPFVALYVGTLTEIEGDIPEGYEDE
jgi:hypothetical protein